MTKIFTRVHVVGSQGGAGLMEHGRRTRSEMIAKLKQKAEHDLHEAQRILAATDGMFEVAVVKGCWVQRDPEIL